MNNRSVPWWGDGGGGWEGVCGRKEAELEGSGLVAFGGGGDGGNVSRGGGCEWWEW